MKFHVIFNKEPIKNTIDFWSTNLIKIDPEDLPINENSNVLTYQLNDHYLTKRFVEAFLKTQALNLFLDDTATYHYNYYMNAIPERVVQAKMAMNDTIDELNSIGRFVIDTELKLDPSKPNVAEFEKINELHFRFEQELMKLPQDAPKGDRIWYLLEKVNNLVHFIERTNETGVPEELYFMTSIRAKCRTQHWYKLRPEDYYHFQYYHAGDLVADFSTVGKDLWAASSTNDMELVKRKECKQQEYITEYAFVPFNTDYTTFDHFWKWCNDNKVSDHLDIHDPKYLPGRHVLGKLMRRITSAQEFYGEVFDKTPYLEGVYMTDDDGNMLL